MRIKIFALLFALWAVIFSVNTVLGIKAAFEYDDGFAYTGDSFRKASKVYTQDSASTKAGEFCFLDRGKPVPVIVSAALVFLGIKTHLIADRPAESSQCLINRWGRKFEKIFFPSTQNEKYLILEKNEYLFYFSASDDGIIQAIKAGIKPVRVERNKNSMAVYEYNPGKFGEKKLPLSYF